MKIAVLEICPEEPLQHHKNIFFNRENEGWDFFYVSHYKPDERLSEEYFIKKEKIDKHFWGNYPGTSWAKTRNILYQKVDKTKYDYYFFIDYDAHLSFNENRKTNNLKIRDEIIYYLKKYQPPIAMPYYADDIPRLNNINDFECSTTLFTNNIIKIIHKSLLKWFLPYLLKYGGTYDSCHFFNILEIPFKPWVCCIHSIIVKNKNHEAPHYKNNKQHKKAMENMYQEFKSAFKWSINPDFTLEKAIDLKNIHQSSIQETRSDKLWLGEATDKLISASLDRSHSFFRERYY